jgi:hypothetical protein
MKQEQGWESHRLCVPTAVQVSVRLHQQQAWAAEQLVQVAASQDAPPLCGLETPWLGARTVTQPPQQSAGLDTLMTVALYDVNDALHNDMLQSRHTAGTVVGEPSAVCTNCSKCVCWTAPTSSWGD